MLLPQMWSGLPRHVPPVLTLRFINLQPSSGHESRQSLESYARLSLTDAQKEYDPVVGRFPIQ